MFDNLSVKESLTSVASLRLAADTGFAERAQRVDNVIAAMELTGEVHKRIDTLSGGQGKRVSTAMELLSDPMLLVLDEPTSGLDEGLDRKMMDSLRSVAANDCAVIVVTHSTVNLECADKVLAITDGGRLAFLGPPAALLDAFGATNYAEVMNQLRAGRVTAVRPQISQAPLGGATVTASPPTRGSLSRHLPRLVGRELARQRNSARQLAITLVSGILLTVGLAFAASPRGLGGDSRAISSTLIALIVLLTFFSMAQSFAAVVDDRDVIDRESRWSISPASMILARALTCAPLAVILGVSSVCLYLLIPGHAPQHTVLPNPTGLLLFAVLLPLAAMSIGLLISTLSKSLRQAVFILTGVLALQVIMTGLAPPFEGKPGEMLRHLSVLTPSRWAAAGLGGDIGIAVPSTMPSQQLPVPPGGHPVPANRSAVPIDSSPFNDAIWFHDASHVYTAAAALVIITVVSLGITIWTLRKKLLSTR
jgi:ABC transport system ATP-binding/permease protein